MATEQTPKLLGTWHLEQADEELGMADPVEMEFRPDGELIYAVEADDGWQVMRLTYEIRGNQLVTDQPSAPNEQRTAFDVDARGALVLDYGGAKCTFVRGEKRLPDA